MILFSFITYDSLYIGLAFCALCLATGLYYLAELAEEYSMYTRKVLRVLFFVIIGVHVALLIFERFPFFTTVFVYFQFLKGFPFFQIQSLTFISSVICFLFTHILWYWHFTDYHTPHYDFYQLLGFFFSCVWLLPTGFFITLSMDNLSLPGVREVALNEHGDILKKKKGNLCNYLTSKFN
jgi:hypothetical protein